MIEKTKNVKNKKEAVVKKEPKKPTENFSKFFNQLKKEIEDLNLPKGFENSMVSKLENALKSLQKGNYKTAINQLNALINEIEAQRSKKFPEEQAIELIAAVEKIIEYISG